MQLQYITSNDMSADAFTLIIDRLICTGSTVENELNSKLMSNCSPWDQYRHVKPETARISVKLLGMDADIANLVSILAKIVLQTIIPLCQVWSDLAWIAYQSIVSIFVLDLLNIMLYVIQCYYLFGVIASLFLYLQLFCYPTIHLWIRRSQQVMMVTSDRSH